MELNNNFNFSDFKANHAERPHHERGSLGDGTERVRDHRKHEERAENDSNSQKVSRPEHSHHQERAENGDEADKTRKHGHGRGCHEQKCNDSQKQAFDNLASLLKTTENKDKEENFVKVL